MIGKERLTEVDMLDISYRIARLPVQKEYEINGKKYSFAHAMTSRPSISQSLSYYMMGTAELDSFFRRNRCIYLMDCGCGFRSGKLACMCIETGERFYTD